jgi:hypothetical protein
MIPAPHSSPLPPPPPPDYNPYAAPVAESERPHAAVRMHVPGEEIKWAFAALSAADVPLRFIVYRWQHLGLTRESRDSFTLVESGFVFLVEVAIYCWTYVAWSTVPLRNRVKNSPMGAVVRTFLPLPVWHIVLQLRLCDGIDEALEESGEVASAPKLLGAVAGSMLLLPYVLFLFGFKLGFYTGIISEVAWFFYMFDCDGSRRVLTEKLASNRAYEQKRALAAAHANALNIARALEHTTPPS